MNQFSDILNFGGILSQGAWIVSNLLCYVTFCFYCGYILYIYYNMGVNYNMREIDLLGGGLCSRSPFLDSDQSEVDFSR